ncbi:hypothetical protein ANN_27167 [Periplaneta americana]|uniref:DUF4817 domain-containing protein n=1 Tax=Periplaneta americana TaxID=6978 RepID=A0ABQ8RXE2_PERAM|nr:hypothetical protein ANN_27167 [Periplaneta americana]
MERVNWTDRMRNDSVLERVGEERMLLKLIRNMRRNWLGHWLRRNCLLEDALEEMVNWRRVRGRRRYQMIDNIKLYGSYYEETKRKAENRKDWRKLGLQNMTHNVLKTWASVVDNQLIGSHDLPPRLTGRVYRQLLEHELGGLLHEAVPLATRTTLRFKHDVVPAYFSREARAYFNVDIPNNVCSRIGFENLNQVTCPDRDSNPGHLVSRPDALTVIPQPKREFNPRPSATPDRQANVLPLELRSWLSIFGKSCNLSLISHLKGCAWHPEPQRGRELRCAQTRKSLPSKETLRGHSDSSFRGEGYIQCCVGVRLCDMYSNQELAEIHFMYGKADGNAALARRLYQERYPQRQCPDRKTFVLYVSITHTKGSVASQCSSYDCLETVERVSIVSLSFATCTGQALSPADYPARVRFCQWFLQQCGVNPNFPALVLFTDEAQFTRDGITNFHNQHVWAYENPRATVPSHHQVRFSLNMWFPDRWIGREGPIAWPPRSPDLNPLDFYLWGHLKSLVYSSPVPDLESLRNRILACSEDIRNTPGVWDRVRRSMRHRCENGTGLEKKKKKKKKKEKMRQRTQHRRGEQEVKGIVQGEEVGFNPADFWLWGYLKERVFLTHPTTLLQLKDAISQEIANIPRHYLQNAVHGVAERKLYVE